MGLHSIGRMLSPRTTGGPAGTPPLHPPGSAMLTRRRQVDYCRVAAALCPAPGRYTAPE
jgi:hypothetical protein